MRDSSNSHMSTHAHGSPTLGMHLMADKILWEWVIFQVGMGVGQNPQLQASTAMGVYGYGSTHAQIPHGVPTPMLFPSNGACSHLRSPPSSSRTELVLGACTNPSFSVNTAVDKGPWKIKAALTLYILWSKLSSGTGMQQTSPMFACGWVTDKVRWEGIN